MSVDVDQDVVQLLLIVRGYCWQFDDHQQGTGALENAKHHVSIFYHENGMRTSRRWFALLRPMVGHTVANLGY